jgi:RHH-type proline utilization regulon transcriptional repressor/proline dehydrogenase/delta 1-pyrroline-5-carboxylate dehydrogenase
VTARADSIERETVALARRIAELGAGERSRVFRMSWWSERMLDWAMARPDFKTQLFRFVDVFPATTDDADVARHLAEYFDGVPVPKALDLGIDLADKVPFGATLEARVARRNIGRMARQFIVGEDAREALDGLHALWRTGSAFTVDLLGEQTVTAAEADRYAARVRTMVTTLTEGTAGWAPDDHLERDDLGRLPRVNISIKPTAIATHYAPLTREVGIEDEDLTLELFRELLEEEQLVGLEAGIVIQAYLKSARADLADLIAWSSRRRAPVTVRLVKGAYWDAETVHARAAGWPAPVFESKDETDASYEACVRLLHDHHGEVRAAFGSHNLRSLAYAIAYARDRGIPDHGYEIQLLHGMAEQVHAAIMRLGLRLRV